MTKQVRNVEVRESGGGYFRHFRQSRDREGAGLCYAPSKINQLAYGRGSD